MNWPTAADDTFGLSTEPPKSVALNLRPMFTSPIGALNALYEMDANGEPVWYPFDVTFSYSVDELDNETYTVDSASSSYAPTTSMTVIEAQEQSDASSLRLMNDPGVTKTIRLYSPKLKDITFGGTLPLSEAALASIKQMIIDVGAPLTAPILDSLIRRNATTGAVSVYMPNVPAFVAYNSFAYGTQATLNLDLEDTGTPTSYTTKGSWYWAMITDYLYCGQFFGWEYPVSTPQ